MFATYLMIKMTSRKDAIISFLQNKAKKLRAICIGLRWSIKEVFCVLSTSLQCTKHHITRCHIISHHIISYYITSHHIILYHITSVHFPQLHFPSNHISTHHITSVHFTTDIGITTPLTQASKRYGSWSHEDAGCRAATGNLINCNTQIKSDS